MAALHGSFAGWRRTKLWGTHHARLGGYFHPGQLRAADFEKHEVCATRLKYLSFLGRRMLD
jgi:hypothetical protein